MTIKPFSAYLISVVAMAILATAMSTQFVLAGLTSLDVSISLPDRLIMTAKDVLGMGPVYAIIIAVALGIALPTAGWASRTLSFPRPLVYAVAGGVAMLVMLLLMEQVFFGLPLISGARTISGLAGQAVTGIFAGWLYARLIPKG